MQVIEEALKRGAKTLSEYESLTFLATHGIPIPQQKVIDTEDKASAVAGELGYPVVLKGLAEGISHKTELNLVTVDLRDEKDVREAYNQLTSCPEVPVKKILIQQMIRGERELVVGLTRDAQFGPCVMFGLGGIFTEVLKDTSFRIAPLSRWDAMDMMEDIRGKEILGAFRGKPEVDREGLADILMAVSQIGMNYDQISEIDINPLKILDGKPVAVDALIVLNQGSVQKEALERTASLTV